MNILKQFEPQFKELQQKTSKQLYDGCKKECIDLRDKVLESYDKVASNYDEKIYQSIRAELEENTKQKLFVSYLNQTKRIIPMIQKFMRNDLQKKLSTGCKNNIYS